MAAFDIPDKPVLIVDDDPMSLMMMEAVVKSASLEAIAASNVSAGIRLLHLHQPRIALIDVQLPDGDGIDILREIRRKNLKTLAAFITGSLPDFPFHKCGTFQPDMIFSKPVDPHAIAAWLERQSVKAGAAEVCR